MVYGSGTELSIKLFGPKAPQVMDSKGPKMEHIVPRKRVPLLNEHHFGAHQGELYSSSQAAGTSSDDEALSEEEQTSLAAQGTEKQPTICNFFSYYQQTETFKEKLEIFKKNSHRTICTIVPLYHLHLIDHFIAYIWMLRVSQAETLQQDKLWWTVQSDDDYLEHASINW